MYKFLLFRTGWESRTPTLYVHLKQPVVLLDELLLPQIQECINQLVVILLLEITNVTYTEDGIFHAATIRTNPHAIFVLYLQENFVGTLGCWMERGNGITQSL